jgi:hypothetical protein
LKIAVGIIGIFLSLTALLQSCSINGLSRLSENQELETAGALGMLTAFLMFFGSAFTFGLPKVARVFFALAFLVSIPARKEFPDMWVWGVASLILGLLLLLVKNKPTDTPTPKNPE